MVAFGEASSKQNAGVGFVVQCCGRSHTSPSNNTGSSQKQGFGYWLCHAILYVTTSPVQPYRLEKADPRQSIVLSFITNSSSIIIINIINIIIIVMITIGNIVIVICCIVQTCMLVRR